MGGIILDLLTQAPEVRRHRALIAVRAPDQLEQAIAAEDLPRMLGQQAQQRELPRREGQRLPVETRLVRAHVHDQGPEIEDALGRRRPAAATPECARRSTACTRATTSSGVADLTM